VEAEPNSPCQLEILSILIIYDNQYRDIPYGFLEVEIIPEHGRNICSMTRERKWMQRWSDSPNTTGLEGIYLVMLRIIIICQKCQIPLVVRSPVLEIAECYFSELAGGECHE